MKTTWLEVPLRALQKLTKKNKYVLASAVITLFVFYLVNYGLVIKLTAVLALTSLVVVAVFITNLGNFSWRNFIISLVLPLSMVLGLVLSFLYFPNLGIVLKVGFSLFFGAQFYIVSLMTNIFLVVQDRGESIPLYRVAATWAQIMVVIAGITVFAGIYKIPIRFMFQTGFAGLGAVVFSLYILWVLGFDKDNKKVSIKESVVLSFFCGFLVFTSSLAVAFLPTEAFLKSILTANVLLFSTSLLYEHLRNNISRNLLLRNFSLILIFLIILLVFNP